MRVFQQPSYVLLTRPYSESSWIVELFTRDYGRIALIAKGARRLKSRLKGVLLPFQPLLVSWTGKGEVPTLTAAEIEVEKWNLLENELQGKALICGFYCNELVTYLLHRHDPHKTLYRIYADTIGRMHQSGLSEEMLAAELRGFESAVVRETGYSISFTHELEDKNRISANASYRFLPNQGFEQCSENEHGALPGRVILSLAKESHAAITGLSTREIAQRKHLMRAILTQSLGYRKINSRELFIPSIVESVK